MSLAWFTYAELNMPHITTWVRLAVHGYHRANAKLCHVRRWYSDRQARVIAEPQILQRLVGCGPLLLPRLQQSDHQSAAGLGDAHLPQSAGDGGITVQLLHSNQSIH